MEAKSKFGDFIVLVFLILMTLFGLYLVFNASNDAESTVKSKEVEEQKLLSQEDLAQYLNISETEVTELESEISSIEIEGKLYFSKSEADRWLGEK